MKCPKCGYMIDKVLESRPSKDGLSIRRRRECEKCGWRFTSYERIELKPIIVIKKNGKHQPFDMSKVEGQRNRAIIETLYSCGLRVSELCNLHMSDLYLEEGFMRVEGKGSKQRLVPVSPRAVNELQTYFQQRMAMSNIKPGHEDYVFLSFRRGTKLSRIMVFHESAHVSPLLCHTPA